jgi:hypothetical protein
VGVGACTRIVGGGVTDQRAQVQAPPGSSSMEAKGRRVRSTRAWGYSIWYLIKFNRLTPPARKRTHSGVAVYTALVKVAARR